MAYKAWQVPPYTLHPTPYTLHPSPFTLHPTFYTLQPKTYTLHPQNAPAPVCGTQGPSLPFARMYFLTWLRAWGLGFWVEGFGFGI